jgi:hypothetical protein
MLSRARLALWLLVSAVIAGTLVLATGRTPPRLPGDRDHFLAQPEARCLTCHGHKASHPRPADHPLRDDCFSCHSDPTGVLHPRPTAPESIAGGWRDDPRLAGRTDAGDSRSPAPARP